MPGFDIHPILVHFPIALLSTYAILEFLRFKFLTRQQYWFYIKAFFAIFGSLTTLPAMLAGELAKAQMTSNQNIAEVHQYFAVSSSMVFLFIGFLYFVAWVKPYVKLNNALHYLVSIQEAVFRLNIIILLALVGLFLITTTGALGGLIVFGANIDPFSKILYSLFFK